MKLTKLIIPLFCLATSQAFADRGMIVGILGDINKGWNITVDNDLRFSIIDVNTNQSRDAIWDDLIEKYPFSVSFNHEKKSIWIQKSIDGVGKIINIEKKQEDASKPQPAPQPVVIVKNNQDDAKLKAIIGEISSVKEETLRVKDLFKSLGQGNNGGLSSDDVSSIVLKIVTELQKKHSNETKLMLDSAELLAKNTLSAIKEFEIRPTLSSTNNFDDYIVRINLLLAKIADSIEIAQISDDNNKIRLDILRKNISINSHSTNSNINAVFEAVDGHIRKYKKNIAENNNALSELLNSILNNKNLINKIGQANTDKLTRIEKNNYKNIEILNKKLDDIDKDLTEKISNTQDIIINIAKSLRKDIHKQTKFLSRLSRMMDKNSKVILEVAKSTTASNNAVIDAVTASKHDSMTNHKTSFKKLKEISDAINLQNDTIDRINKENELIKRSRGESDVVVRLLIDSLFDIYEAKDMIVTDVFVRKTGFRHINIHIGSMILKYGNRNNRIIRNKDIKLTLNESGLVQIEGIRGGDEVYYIINRWYHEKYKKLTGSNKKHRLQTKERKLVVKFDIQSQQHKSTHDLRNQGKKTYESKCYNCHESGFGGAVGKDNKKYWSNYINHSDINLSLANLKNGIGKMPKNGTCHSCSDNELKQAIKYLAGFKD